MTLFRNPILIVCILFLTVTGCYNKKIRHLASDASLVKVGSSSRSDVLTYLGEPDGIRQIGEKSEEWVYLEEKVSGLQRTPIVGGYFDGKGYDKIFIVLVNDIVQSCQFREYEEDEMDWADDFDWQEKEE